MLAINVLLQPVLRCCSLNCRYVPFGMKEWFYGENVTNVVELGWWEHAIHGNSSAAVFLLPAQHWYV